MYDAKQQTLLNKLWRRGRFWDTFDDLKGKLHCSCKITYTVSLELLWLFLNFNHLAVSLQIWLKFNCFKPRGSPYWKHIKVLTWNLIISTVGLMTEVVRLIKQQNRNLLKWVWNCIYDKVIMHSHPFVPELQRALVETDAKENTLSLSACLQGDCGCFCENRHQILRLPPSLPQ